MFLNDKTKDDVIRQHHLAKKLLLLFLESELTRLSVWCNPLNATGHGLPAVFTGNTERSLVMEDSWKEMIRFAWEVSPRLAVQMETRFVPAVVRRELHRLIANNSLDVVDVPEALMILLGDRLMPNAKLDLKVKVHAIGIQESQGTFFLSFFFFFFVLVSTILGTCTCDYSCQLLFTRLQQ